MANFLWLSDKNFRGIKAFKRKDRAKLIDSVKDNPTINLGVQHTPNIKFLDRLYLGVTKRDKLIARQSLAI